MSTLRRRWLPLFCLLILITVPAGCIAGDPLPEDFYVTDIYGDNGYFTNLTVGGAPVGDVIGPAGAADNAVARYDGVTGRLIQDSVVIVDDFGNLSTPNDLDGFDISAANNLNCVNDLDVTDDADIGGTLTMGDVIDMNTHQINNLVDPTLPQDAMTKVYMETTLSANYVPYVGANVTVDLNSQDLDNVSQLNLTDPVELTINAGAITVTQGFHTVDTEGDAAEDFLDTINGGMTGDMVTIKPNHTDRHIIVRGEVDNIRLRTHIETRAYGFNSPAGASGIFYAGGFYRAPAADANLTQAAPAVNYGTANVAYGAHAFLVAGGVGAVDVGTCSIVVSGTSVTDAGARVAADTETIVADITAMVLDAYYETAKKWIGTVAFTLVPAGATVYSADFNYGYAKYDDFGNQRFYLTDFECVGRAGANDAGFNIRLLHHSSGGWTYNAAAFVPGGTALADMNTDYAVEMNLANGLPFAYKRDNLSQEVAGDASEGIVVEVTTSANKAVDRMGVIIKAHSALLQTYLDNTEEAAEFIYDGSNWCQIG